MPCFRSTQLAVALLLGAGLWGCQVERDTSARSLNEPPASPAGNPPAASVAPSMEIQLRLARGTGPAEVTIKDRGDQSMASGPSAVAVWPDGAALILDRLNGRVLTIPSDGNEARPLVNQVPVDAEELTAGPDGAIVAFSPVRASAWFFEPSGEPAGEIAVPRTFRHAQRFSLSWSRRLRLHSALQEIFELGSPSAPLPLTTTLHTKREGATLLANGRGVQVRVIAANGSSQGVRQGDVLLQVLKPFSEGERAAVGHEHRLAGPVSSARIVGSDGDIVCLRLEQVTKQNKPAVTVDRRVLCLNALTGNVTLQRELPPVGLYLPRTELAVGGGRLAFIHPAEQGLDLTTWAIGEDGSQEVAP